MRKLKKDPIREDRIHNEAIVDAYGPEERALGWYCYLKNWLRFLLRPDASLPESFHRSAKVRASTRMAPEDAWSADMLVLIRWQGRTIAVPFVPTGRSQLFRRVLEGQGVGRFR
jgi:hypothetical protein